MSVSDVSKRKTGSVSEFTMTGSQMVLEIVSLFCIIVSLAISGMNLPEMTLQSMIIPALIILVYLVIGLGARYPQYFPRLNGMAKDHTGEYQSARETLSWLKTEVIWTLLCIQGIFALSGVIEESTTRLAMMIVLGITWLLINGTLLWLITRISEKQ